MRRSLTADRLILAHKCHPVEDDTSRSMGLPNGSGLSCGATRPPAHLSLNDSSCPSGHNHSDSLKSDRPASFKRLVGGALHLGDETPTETLDLPPAILSPQNPIATPAGHKDHRAAAWRTPKGKGVPNGRCGAVSLDGGGAQQ